MSIYDMTEDLLTILFQDEPVELPALLQKLKRYQSMIEDDDSYAAERIRALIQSNSEVLDETLSVLEKEERDELEERIEDIEENQAETDELNSVDTHAVDILEIYIDEITYHPVLENIKNIVFDYFDSYDDDVPYQTQISIAHRILEML